MTAIPEREWLRAVDSVTAATEVALTCHVGPDGDALGSLLAFGIGLRSLGRHPVASWGSEPFEVPRSLASLPGQELLVPPERFPAAPDVLIAFDTGSVDRLGTLASSVAGAATVLVVDHHVSNTCFGDVHLIDPDAAATVVLVEQLLGRLEAPLTAEVATSLYAGLSTDTGSFRFASTTPATHRLAARLLATGFAHDRLARELYDTNRVAYLKLMGRALDRLTLEPDAVDGLGMAWTFTTTEDLASFDVAPDELEGLIGVARTAAEAEVAVVCKGESDGWIKVSTRSKGRIDVGAVCAALGGGGHRFAAGYSCRAEVPAVMAQLRAALAAAPRLPG